MRVLLDTSTLLWWISGEVSRLSDRARGLIADPANDAYVSVASAWEIAIKVERGRLKLPMSTERYVPDVLARFRFDTLEIELAHALRAGSLPPIHHDPFDRLLVAQAQLEDMPLITADPAIGRYDVEVVS